MKLAFHQILLINSLGQWPKCTFKKSCHHVFPENNFKILKLSNWLFYCNQNSLYLSLSQTINHFSNASFQFFSCFAQEHELL